MTDEKKSDITGDQGQQPSQPVQPQQPSQGTPVSAEQVQGQAQEQAQGQAHEAQQQTHQQAQQYSQQQPYHQPYQQNQGQTPPAGQAPYGHAAPYGQQQAHQHPGYGKAMGSLICGIAAIVFSMFPLIGIILGIIAVILASQYVKAYGKDGKTTAGKITGIIGIVLGVLAIIFYIVMIAFSYSYMGSGSGSGTMPYSSPDGNRSTPYSEISTTFDNADTITIESLTLD